MTTFFKVLSFLFSGYSASYKTLLLLIFHLKYFVNLGVISFLFIRRHKGEHLDRTIKV